MLRPCASNRAESKQVTLCDDVRIRIFLANDLMDGKCQEVWMQEHLKGNGLAPSTS